LSTPQSEAAEHGSDHDCNVDCPTSWEQRLHENTMDERERWREPNRMTPYGARPVTLRATFAFQ
jgi:hypothetical protein